MAFIAVISLVSVWLWLIGGHKYKLGRKLPSTLDLVQECYTQKRPSTLEENETDFHRCTPRDNYCKNEEK